MVCKDAVYTLMYMYITLYLLRICLLSVCYVLRAAFRPHTVALSLYMHMSHVFVVADASVMRLAPEGVSVCGSAEVGDHGINTRKLTAILCDN